MRLLGLIPAIIFLIFIHVNTYVHYKKYGELYSSFTFVFVVIFWFLIMILGTLWAFGVI
jgi:glucan phosphoethanolaminetransferase (alkaline phosphatase superfamily)